MSVAFLAGAAVAAGLIPGGQPARAAAGTAVDLVLEVEPDLRGCPDPEAFRSSVRRQLGYDPFAPNSERTVLVSIGRKATAFTGHIRWNDGSGRWAGERRLSSRKPDCASIAQDLAFSVAVQVQLLATLAPVEAKPSAGGAAPTIAAASSSRKDGAAPSAAASAPAPSSESPSRPAASALVGPEPSPSPSRADAASTGARETVPAATAPSPASRTQASSSNGLSLSAGLGPAFSWGLAPRPTPVGRLFVDVRWSRISLELAVDGAWPVTHQLARVGGFTLDRASGAAAGCGHVNVLVACVLGTVGVLRARDAGVDVATSPTGLFFQLGARLGARFNLGDTFFAGVRGDGLWQPGPWTVDVNGVPVWTTPRAGVLIGADVGAIFF